MWTKRKLIFIYDVFWFTLTAFGGAQAHLGMMLKNFVRKRQYISESELLELHALTQILPGPSSTQTLIGIAFKVGGLPIAIVTFFIWILPSTTLMCLAVLSYTLLGQKEKFDEIYSKAQEFIKLEPKNDDVKKVQEYLKFLKLLLVVTLLTFL
jgi:chromate transporter